MSTPQKKIDKILETLRQGTHDVRKNPSDSNYKKWEGRIERSGGGLSWGRMLLIGGVVGACLIIIIFTTSTSSKNFNASNPVPVFSKPYAPAAPTKQEPSQPVQPIVKEEATPSTEEAMEEEDDIPAANFPSEQSEPQPLREEIPTQRESPLGNTRIIRVHTNRRFPPGSRFQVLIYDNNRNAPREATIVYSNFHDFQLEIELTEPISAGSRYTINCLLPQRERQRQVYMPQRQRIYVPQPPRMIQRPHRHVNRH